MIPVELKPEPQQFAEFIRLPGQRFLAQVANPTSEQWAGKEYWQRILPEMSIIYHRICAYCAHWIPHSTGSHSIDHFIPKSQAPLLAYEWHNFRYVSARFNSRKGTNAILDPFQLQPNWFVLNFTSFLIVPNPDLTPEQKESVTQTVKILMLNTDDDLVAERVTYIRDYQNGVTSFDYLKRRAPFIAYELQRQGLLRSDEQMSNS